jgi:archaemetzincin
VRFMLLMCDVAVEETVVTAVQRALAHVLKLDVRVDPHFPDPQPAYDPKRNQYDSSTLLVSLAHRASENGSWILGLTGRDLYVPMLTFVFGQAQLGGRVAIVSLARLRQEFYGLPADPALVRERAVKEALHEMGHALGLVHCVEPLCAMSLSTQVEQVDAKLPDICTSCRTLLLESGPAQEESAVDGPA